MAPKCAKAPGRSAPRYAPDLPPDLLDAIMLPLAGHISTLCAAACVNKAWHAAALHPRLWAKLNTQVLGKSCLYSLTDARLATLVRRACGFDADGNAHTLLSLRATSSKSEVTLRGVLAALRGPRDGAGAPLLLGALRTLHVRGVKHRFTSKDAKLVRQLCALCAHHPPGRAARGQTWTSLAASPRAPAHNGMSLSLLQTYV